MSTYLAINGCQLLGQHLYRIIGRIQPWSIYSNLILDDVVSWHAFLITGSLSGEWLDSLHKVSVIRGCDIFDVVSMNKLLNKHSSRRWLKTLCHSYVVTVMHKAVSVKQTMQEPIYVANIYQRLQAIC